MRQKHSTNNEGPDTFIRIIHLGLILFGITAWLTGDAADDHHGSGSLWFSLHSWTGMGLGTFLAAYLMYGIIGPRHNRFSQWIPWTKKRLLMVLEDSVGLLRFRLPDRPGHQGLAGMVQSMGFLLFLGMTVTGLFLGPGGRFRGLAHAMEEVHELGEVLIPLYLSIHVGAVLLHTVTGNHVWKRIFFVRKAKGTPCSPVRHDTEGAIMNRNRART